MILGYFPFKIASDSNTLQAKTAVIAKNRNSLIVYCCFIISQNEFKFRNLGWNDLWLTHFQNYVWQSHPLISIQDGCHYLPFLFKKIIKWQKKKKKESRSWIFSINFKSQVGNQVSDYILLLASGIFFLSKFSLFELLILVGWTKYFNEKLDIYVWLLIVVRLHFIWPHFDLQ
jgi:hypothetical protein